MAKFTLLQEALIEERLLNLEKYVIDKKNTPGHQIVKTLLPNFNYFPKVERLYDTKARIKRCHGGVGGGKTVHGVADDIKTAWFNAPYPHLMFSPTQDNADVVTGTILEEFFRQNYIKYKKYKSDGLYVVYWTNSESEAAHMYNWGVGNFIKGVSAASGSFKEAYSQPRKDILVAEERIRFENDDLWFSILYDGTCEPEVMQHGKDEYEKPDCDTEEEYKVTMRTQDNPHLTTAYIDNLYNKYTPEERKVYLDGIYTPLASGTRMYINFTRDKNVRPYSEYLAEGHSEGNRDEVYKMILGFDFNVNPITASLNDLKGKQRRQINEFKINRSNTAELCETIIEKLKLLYPEIAGKKRQQYMLYITGDASGKREQTSSFGWNDHDIIRKYFHSSGIQCHDTFDNSNGPVIGRVNYVNNLFDKDLGIIYDNCKDSIEDRELAKWKGGAEGYVADKSNKNRTHLNDATDYAWRLTARMGIDDYEGDNYGDEIIFGDKRRIT